MSRFILPYADVGSGIKPSSGAKLFFFDTNTSTPKNTYSDEALSTANANPVISDSNGLFGDIWLDSGQYKVILEDKNGSQKWEADPVDSNTRPSDVVANFSTLAAATASTKMDAGDALSIKENISGNGGGATWDVIAGIGAANGYSIVAHDTLDLSLELRISGTVTLEQLGVIDGPGLEFALNYSGVNNSVLSGKASFELTARIDLTSKFLLNSNKGDIVITASATYFDGSEAFMIYGDSATTIADSFLEGVTVIGGLSDFVSDGIDRHGIRIDGCTNTSIRNCVATTLERGIMIRNGSSGGEMAYNDAINCYDHGVSYFGTSSEPIFHVSLHDNTAETNGFTTQRKMSGMNFEEVYDSTNYNNRSVRCDVGHRWENSCDNSMYNNVGINNDSVGGQLYNFSQRNAVYGNSFIDNNVANWDSIGLTPENKGNAETRLSGLELQAGGHNNSVTANKCYQTPATTIPFTSGSVEPTIGDTLTGAVSGQSGRVRRIDLTSGTFAGGDAAGTFHLVDVALAFNSGEIVDNTTSATSDIATTNGSTTLGTSIGFQKYGIGINIRNLTATSDIDSYNIIEGNQCFNNDLGAIEDRGRGNNIAHNTDNDFYINIIRNV